MDAASSHLCGAHHRILTCDGRSGSRCRHPRGCAPAMCLLIVNSLLRCWNTAAGINISTDETNDVQSLQHCWHMASKASSTCGRRCWCAISCCSR
jgi:hypothetical protein